MAVFYCGSILYVRFRAFLFEFNRQFLKKINVFLINTVLGQVGVIANDMIFLKN